MWNKCKRFQKQNVVDCPLPVLIHPDDGAVIFVATLVVLHAGMYDGAHRLVYVIGAYILQKVHHLGAC